MPINVRCRCGRRIKVRDSAAGKRVRCPDCGKPVSVPEPEPEYIEDYEEYEEYGDDSYDDNPYGDSSYGSQPAPRKRRKSGGAKKKKKSSGGGVPTPLIIVGAVCVAALAIGGTLYAVLGGGGGNDENIAAADNNTESTDQASAGTSSDQGSSGSSDTTGTAATNRSSNNSNQNTNTVNSNTGTPTAESSEMMTTSSSNDQLWVVLSDFKKKADPNADGTPYQISYRIAAGRPDPGKRYVIYVGSAMGMVMERYNEIDINLQASGTVDVRAPGQNAKAYVAIKKGHQEWEPVSGKISLGGQPSEARRPPTVLEAAGAAAQGKMFALANPRFEKGRIGRNSFVVDYVMQAPMQGGKFFFLVIQGDSGDPVEADVSRSLFRANRGDADKFAISMIGPGSFPQGNLRVHVEMRNSPGRSRMQQGKAEIVSNTATMQR